MWLNKVNPKEDFIEGGLRRRLTRDFFKYKVGSLSNMSLTEFFELAYSEVEYIIELCRNITHNEAVNNNNQLNELNKPLTK
ncbi:hypothetical protein fnug_95 [Pseudomonas phage fnug]|uniref:PHIKZ076.4 n=6 Tax=Viruses TaxID=10239 RepID=L7T490_BPDPK|nr:hypothetical protein FDI90_gp304 [Pseudomonas phage PA7]YP_009639903.1 PHIKZ076.4 [Pseudomonas phage phiKZ]ANM44860.1 hypothetical protein KTN4_102 [Pseudomonas phage KTN4]QJB22738.1 hypothetical protein fnug_95 [Pseudomonas phage fnug]QYV98999.1 hypothetical protein [Pseudomonas phage T2P]QYV99259.1 hypothetical protein [Pseudomonas phage U1B]QYV99715.1 hypothetical protein [Pseudomonas phage U5]USL86682.1 hypothetical protein CDGHABPJ_00224 [Pseudomonas phage OMKO1]UXD83079.1 hypotheti